MPPRPREFSTSCGRGCTEFPCQSSADTTSSTLWRSGVPHFDGKAQSAYLSATARALRADPLPVDEYLKASGVPRTSLYNSAYMENLVTPVIGFQMCKKLDDGTISVEIPSPEDRYMPFYSVDQTGGWVLAALKNPAQWIGALLEYWLDARAHYAQARTCMPSASTSPRGRLLRRLAG